MPGQQQQHGGQQHRVQDEEQVVDQDPHQDQVPGPGAGAAGASVPEGGAHRVDAEEQGAHGAVQAPRQPAGDSREG